MEQKRGLVSIIECGDTVIILNRFNQRMRGKAVMRSAAGGWVLNMGGRYGTPVLADNNNIVDVIKKGKKK